MEPSVNEPLPLEGAGARSDHVGGKASSLTRLIDAGFRVPEGVVLPVQWFAPWWAELEATAAWAAFRQTDRPPCSESCRALQARAHDLAYTERMRSDLAEIAQRVDSWGAHATCAVRSSSPHEDLAEASFAGGYATSLGVNASELEDAVRTCFMSCLDERVLSYHHQIGLDAAPPRIAVLVQRQLNSDVAGVAFSLNPITNDYDEALIEANFGLGETVVSGEVTPDRFVVDKNAGAILERHLGSKKLVRRLKREGGVELVEGLNAREEEPALSDSQVL